MKLSLMIPLVMGHMIFPRLCSLADKVVLLCTEDIYPLLCFIVNNTENSDGHYIRSKQTIDIILVSD